MKRNLNIGETAVENVKTEETFDSHSFCGSKKILLIFAYQFVELIDKL